MASDVTMETNDEDDDCSAVLVGMYMYMCARTFVIVGVFTMHIKVVMFTYIDKNLTNNWLPDFCSGK